MFIEVACAVFSVQAEPFIFTSEYVKEIYQELPKKRGGDVVDSIDFFHVRVDVDGDKFRDVGVEINNFVVDNPDIKAFVERKILELLLAKSDAEIIRVLERSKCRMLYNGDDYQKGPFWNLKKGVEVLRNCNKISYRSDDANFYLSIEDFSRNKLGLTFPINIQIITDKNKMELENEFEGLLNSDMYSDVQNQISNSKSRFSRLDPVGDIYVCNNTSFLHTEAINDVTYYLYDGDQFKPVFSPKYEVESFTNLFHFSNEYTNNIDLHIMHWTYGNKTNEFTIKLDNLIRYCQANELEVYVGIEKREEGGAIESSILLQNKAMKYLHILHVRSNVASLLELDKKKDDRGEMMVNLYTYIPTDNVDNIYNDESYERRYNKFKY
ncbi:MAG: hypothetical protein SNF68_01025 [Rikenellaceae bacterium]